MNDVHTLKGEGALEERLDEIRKVQENIDQSNDDDAKNWKRAA